MFSGIILLLIGGAVFGIVHAVRKGEAKHLVPAFIAFVLACGVGAWAIFQSRSSTAAIGLIFLPFFALIPALGGWLASYFRHKSQWLSVVGYLLIAVVLVAFVYSGFETRQKNNRRDEEQKKQNQITDRCRSEIKTLIQKNPGNEIKALTELLSRHKGERPYVIAALETKYVGVEQLKEYSQSDDMGIALMVIRNENSTAEMLENVYNRASYKDYFFVDLSRNKKTPTKLLAEIAKGHNHYLPESLLAHPSLNCEIIKNLKGALESGYETPERKKHYLDRIAEIEPKLCR